ncbi:hypothetical protein KEM52_004635, partial [Ascosphaera acerosa]
MPGSDVSDHSPKAVCRRFARSVMQALWPRSVVTVIVTSPAGSVHSPRADLSLDGRGSMPDSRQPPAKITSFHGRRVTMRRAIVATKQDLKALRRKQAPNK